MQIRVNNQINPAEWNRYAEQHVWHRFEWYDIIGQVYRLRPHFALCTEGSEFALMPGFRVGRGYRSLPFVYMAGPLSNSTRAHDALKLHLAAHGLIAQYRAFRPCSQSTVPRPMTSVVHAVNAEAYWASLSKKMRAQIAGSQQQGFTHIQERNVDRFYEIYSRKMHALGTPAHPRRFFEKIIALIPHACVETAMAGDVAAGSMVTLRGLDAVEQAHPAIFITWAATVPAFDARYVNYFLYSSVIRRHLDAGIQHIDLGTSHYGSTHFDFKQKWRPVNYEVFWEGETGSKNYRDNTSLVLLSRVWRTLPYPLARWLGPRLRVLLP